MNIWLKALILTIATVWVFTPIDELLGFPLLSTFADDILVLFGSIYLSLQKD